MTDRNPDATAFEYLAALDAGDLAKLEAMWRQAIDSPELARELAELTAAAADEVDEALGRRPTDAQRVLELARLHVPSAFADEPDDPLPLTAADVAARLKSEPGLSKTDTGANDQLLSNATPLPDQLAAPQLERWIAGLDVAASPGYWKQFRRTAVLLRMSRCQTGAKLAAAREAKSKRESS